MHKIQLANFRFMSWRHFYFRLTQIFYVPLGVLLLSSMLVACASTPDQAMDTPPASDIDYDQNSWKTLIDPACTSFFDGCNQCRRAPGSLEAACSRKACVKYQKPYCLDDTSNRDKPRAKKLSFSCEGNNAVTVYYGEFGNGAQRLKLQPDQMMFVDGASHTASLLTLVPAASGSRYCDGITTFWVKGDSALLASESSGDAAKYRNCITGS